MNGRFCVLKTAALVGMSLGVWDSVAAQKETVGFSGSVDLRAETGYLSSSGTLIDTRPVVEQLVELQLQLAEYGRMTVCGWDISSLHGGRDSINRRAFYLFEATAGYGYDITFSESLDLVNEVGIVWDSPWGYKDYSQEEVAWWFRQSVENPFAVPYVEAIGLFTPDRWLRVAVGLRRAFSLGNSLTLIPFVEAVWGDVDRFEACYGETPSQRFLGGAFMTMTPGFRLNWDFAESWTLWFRVREFVTVDPQARRIVDGRDLYFAQNEATIFSVGLSYRF